MATIYIISGPPGIGKSTAGKHFVPNGIAIIDADMIAQRYRTQGFNDYKDIGNLKFNDLVRQQIISGNDFGIELNLGFQSHYDYIKSVKAFNSNNTLEVLLFYTDNLDLCHLRAQIRHGNGLHHVSRETIDQMYKDTLPLLKQNFTLISNLTAINVTDSNKPRICMQYFNSENKLNITANLPKWVEKDLKEFLNIQLNVKKMGNVPLPEQSPKLRKRKGLRR